MQQCHSIQGLGITRLRNLLTNYTSVNLYIDEGFEEYKKFLSDPDQKKFCFKGYYYVEVKEQDDKELSGLMGRVVYE